MKIFTTALIALGPLTYSLSAGATYYSNSPAYPTGAWSVAIIGGAHDWMPDPNEHYSVFDATVIELTVNGLENGQLQAKITEHVSLRREVLNYKWKTGDYNPLVPQDYPAGATGFAEFGQQLWEQGSACPLDDLQKVDAKVTYATALSNTPGTHTRVVTVELTGVNTTRCAILTSNRVRR
ncbi:hypothetical protein FPC62_19590 [Salmonella enterica]|uniref:Uncharacterized protein n=1 Tax=Salmonella enterica TaxID=28901 RepID=A0A5T8BIG6_SALER|nr:hypothetical protein [Salmonella enterica]EBN4403372.1 hypothetical protein [Salmonella enterica]EBU0748166.1 hypothetical protein [Salmonella enterica]ECH3816243.1 hypothetical protein [Salmonella enterica]EGC1083173.1 hypothetical protein [Salmonella enterica]